MGCGGPRVWRWRPLAGRRGRRRRRGHPAAGGLGPRRALFGTWSPASSQWLRSVAGLLLTRGRRGRLVAAGGGGRHLVGQGPGCLCAGARKRRFAKKYSLRAVLQGWIVPRAPPPLYIAGTLRQGRVGIWVCEVGKRLHHFRRPRGLGGEELLHPVLCEGCEELPGALERDVEGGHDQPGSGARICGQSARRIGRAEELVVEVSDDLFPSGFA